ncbi:polysaccharide biosynthesis protein [Fontibacter flavus]|uniref:Polysaccharide biosynthesis protein n=1 Tax=Fontibacter flavus TaxID=654838 RepID=A0ABV6FRR9_9BACT
MSLPFEKINHELKNKICLITGGIGDVGTTLFNDLLKFDPKEIILLDNRITENSEEFILGKKISKVNCDIRDEKKLQEIFKKYQPEIIFHTAAVRDPGYAELHITETVQTNVLGTWNLANACENTPSVQKLIFSSTGKASRYLTEEVYAASKKMCEYILDSFAKKGRVQYGMVRFTHIYCNSLMDKQLNEYARFEDAVKIHSPGKFVTAQNLGEASYLMLNALLYLEPEKSNFLMVRNLEWPVESLEIALFYIKEYKRKIPVIFCGNPKGYKEKFFRGQLDWNQPNELNLLINVYENQKRKLNEEQDIIISSIFPVSIDYLKDLINKLHKIDGEQNVKNLLIEGSVELFKQSLSTVNKQDTINILKWGISPKFLEAEKAVVSDYGQIVPILIESLKESPHFSQIEDLIHNSSN